MPANKWFQTLQAGYEGARFRRGIGGRSRRPVNRRTVGYRDGHIEQAVIVVRAGGVIWHQRRDNATIRSADRISLIRTPIPHVPNARHGSFRNLANLSSARPTAIRAASAEGRPIAEASSV
jgi:hypothetical protein